MSKIIIGIVVVIMYVLGGYEFLSGNQELGLLWIIFTHMVINDWHD